MKSSARTCVMVVEGGEEGRTLLVRLLLVSHIAEHVVVLRDLLLHVVLHVRTCEEKRHHVIERK